MLNNCTEEKRKEKQFFVLEGKFKVANFHLLFSRIKLNLIAFDCVPSRTLPLLCLLKRAARLPLKVKQNSEENTLQSAIMQFNYSAISSSSHISRDNTERQPVFSQQSLDADVTVASNARFVLQKTCLKPTASDNQSSALVANISTSGISQQATQGGEDSVYAVTRPGEEDRIFPQNQSTAGSTGLHGGSGGRLECDVAGNFKTALLPIGNAAVALNKNAIVSSIADDATASGKHAGRTSTENDVSRQNDVVTLIEPDDMTGLEIGIMPPIVNADLTSSEKFAKNSKDKTDVGVRATNGGPGPSTGAFYDRYISRRYDDGNILLMIKLIGLFHHSRDGELDLYVASCTLATSLGGIYHVAGGLERIGCVKKKCDNIIKWCNRIETRCACQVCRYNLAHSLCDRSRDNRDDVWKELDMLEMSMRKLRADLKDLLSRNECASCATRRDTLNPVLAVVEAIATMLLLMLCGLPLYSWSEFILCGVTICIASFVSTRCLFQRRTSDPDFLSETVLLNAYRFSTIFILFPASVYMEDLRIIIALNIAFTLFLLRREATHGI